MKKFIALLIMSIILSILAFNTYYTSEYDYRIPDNTVKISEPVFRNNTYVEAIQTFLDCINNHDVEGIMKISYPDKYADTMYILNREEIRQEMESVTEDLSETVTLIDIISEEVLGDEEKEMFYDSFVFMQILTDYVRANDIKDNTDFRFTIDEEKRLATTPYCKIKDLYVVDCVLKYENQNGGTFTAEQPFIMMKIAGEGWKTDIEMMDYIMDGRQNAIDLISLNLKLYVDNILDILAEDGVEIPEKCTISSDGSKNSNVSDEFLSIFTETLLTYNYYEDLDYVIEIENGVCINAECSESFITHYPDSSESQDVEHIFTFENDILNDIYDTYSEKFKKAINKMKEVKDLW
ncbi:MAG: hypothetical protein K2G36_07570 [Ruminococcus sp.]|nr:hypothetical protein [Ruminococcus sp.]